MRYVIILLAAPAIASAAPSQCRSGACASNTIAAAPAAAQHGWYEGGGGRLALYWRGESIGMLDPRTAEWQTSGRQHTVNLLEAFGLSSATSISPPAPAEKPIDTSSAAGDAARQERTPSALAANFGVDWSQIRKDGESYRIGGVEVPKQAVYDMLAAGNDKVPDDSATPRLVVLGSDAARAQVVEDLSRAPELTPFKQKMIVQAYPPDHWHVAGVGYRPLGDPTIYVVDAQGKVATVQKDYDGGAGRLARTLKEGLRAADPHFDPSQVPDLSRPPAPPNLTMNAANSAGIGVLTAVAAGVGVLFYRKKRRN